MASKLTTNLTGLAVAKDPKKMLKMYYTLTLKFLTQMPENAIYRQSAEGITRKRLSLLESEKEISDLEQKINCGQIEEVIIQAKNELNLAKDMLKWKPWEPLCEKPTPNQWKWPI